MNKQESPCQSYPDYFFHECIERKLISRLGCKPSWINITTSVNKTCTERESIRNYLQYMAAVNLMGAKTFAMRYGCITPCNYVEYQVWPYKIDYIDSIQYLILFIAWWRTTESKVKVKSNRNKNNVVKPNYVHKKRGVGLSLHVFFGWFWGCVGPFHWVQFLDDLGYYCFYNWENEENEAKLKV